MSATGPARRPVPSGAEWSPWLMRQDTSAGRSRARRYPGLAGGGRRGRPTPGDQAPGGAITPQGSRSNLRSICAHASNSRAITAGGQYGYCAAAWKTTATRVVMEIRSSSHILLAVTGGRPGREVEPGGVTAGVPQRGPLRRAASATGPGAAAARWRPGQELCRPCPGPAAPGDRRVQERRSTDRGRDLGRRAGAAARHPAAVGRHLRWGYGRLHARRAEVTAEGRGALVRPRRAWLLAAGPRTARSPPRPGPQTAAPGAAGEGGWRRTGSG